MRLRLGGQLPKRKSANQLSPSAMAAQQIGQMSRTQDARREGTDDVTAVLSPPFGP